MAMEEKISSGMLIPVSLPIPWVAMSSSKISIIIIKQFFLVNFLRTKHSFDLTDVRLGHTEEISTMTLSNDVTVLASAQCSIRTHDDEYQSKIIIWDTKNLRQKFSLNQAVQAIQAMAFSK